MPETNARVIRFPWARTAKKISNLSIAVVALGAMLLDTRLFPTEAFGTAISKFQKSKVADVNLRALKAGAGLAAE